DVPAALMAARNLAVETEVAPAGITTLLRRFRREGSPVGPLATALGALEAELATPSNVEAYFPGCAAIAREPYDVRIAQAVGRALGSPLPLAPGVELCCGYPLYAAGDRQGFMAQARRVATRLAGLGRVVVGDPGCAHTLRTLYREVGHPLRAEVVPLPERLAESIAAAPKRPPLEETVTYHDPCYLARPLGCTEPPRAILKRAVSRLVEPDHARGDTICAGAGGAVPWSMPAESLAMTSARASELGAAAPLVVTACPTAKRALSRGGARVRDLAAVLADWLGVTA
ncbi:MAG: (Fe-S)-binding protein, partial [Deltaproteobacteria bacterium]